MRLPLRKGEESPGIKFTIMYMIHMLVLSDMI